MKKVSKRVQSTKLNEGKYFSLNGNMLNKVNGRVLGGGNTDRACSGGCSATAAWGPSGLE